MEGKKAAGFFLVLLSFASSLKPMENGKWVVWCSEAPTSGAFDRLNLSKFSGKFVLLVNIVWQTQKIDGIIRVRPIRRHVYLCDANLYLLDQNECYVIDWIEKSWLPGLLADWNWKRLALLMNFGLYYGSWRGNEKRKLCESPPNVRQPTTKGQE